jgi:hypothetical protein
VTQSGVSATTNRVAQPTGSGISSLSQMSRKGTPIRPRLSSQRGELNVLLLVTRARGLESRCGPARARKRVAVPPESDSQGVDKVGASGAHAAGRGGLLRKRARWRKGTSRERGRPCWTTNVRNCASRPSTGSGT